MADLPIRARFGAACCVHLARCALVVLFCSGAVSPTIGDDFVLLSGAYRVVFSGLRHTDLEPLFKQVSDTFMYRDRPPPTEGLLRMRLRMDEVRFRKLLMSRGYYNAVIRTEFSGDPDTLLVTVNVLLNDPFVYGMVNIGMTNAIPGMIPELPSSKELGLPAGRPATFREITDAEVMLISTVRNQGYPFAAVVSRRVEADYASNHVNVRWILSPGKRARFGPLSVEGLKHVHRSLINRMTPWKQGALYDPVKVRAFQDMLSRCGLFSVVMLSNRSETDAEDEVAMELDVTESPRHSIGFGAGYNTEKGPGVSANWENRDCRGHGECLHTEANVSEKQVQGEITYEIPHFFQRGIGLKTFTRLGEDRPRAYESVYWKNQAGMSWDVTPRLNVGFAYAWKVERVEQFGQTTRHYLQSYPFNVMWDFRNDQVEPTHGGVLFAEAEYITDWEEDQRFVKEHVRYRPIVTVWKYPQITLGGNVGGGSLQGGGVFDVPADQRFYAGGSDTIRGYAYQMAGPLLDDDPTGGCSMLALSGEVCVKVYGPVGLVAFLDGGNVFSESTPGFNEDLLWGAGGGIRVFTPVGAIGIEAGFPLNPRPVDDPHQFYITIGLQF